MMHYLETFKIIANKLDEKGLERQANRIDLFLQKKAQQAEVEQIPSPEEVLKDISVPDKSSSQTSEKDIKEMEEKLARTAYLMYERLRDLFHRYLPQLDYFGEDNIEVILSTFDHFLTLFRTVMRGKSADYNREELEYYVGQLKKSERELNRSVKMRLTPAKVKVDKFYLYEELEVLTRKLQRLYDKGAFPELNPVVKKSRALRDTFANVIKQRSEEIANADLIEIS